MKHLLFVENSTEDMLRYTDLQEVHQLLVEELCHDVGAQTSNEMFKRYVRAYEKLQKIREGVVNE